MWVLSILPFGKTAPQRELSYWSPQDVPEGSIVRIPVRGKNGYGLVMQCAALERERSAVRKSGFALQKISGEGRRLFTRAFLHAVFETASHHAVSAGAVIDAIAPAAILAELQKLPEAAFVAEAEDSHFEPLACIGSREERYGEYRTLARESLAGGRPLLIVASTVAEAENVAAALRTGIEDRVILLHGELGKKGMREAWERMCGLEPIVVVSTPMGLCAPRSDWSAVILERDSARGYVREFDRPYIDTRVLALNLARRSGARFIMCGPCLTVENAWRESHEDLQYLGERRRQISGGTTYLIDMRATPAQREKRGGSPRKPFETLGRDAAELIGLELAGGKGVFILAARKGLGTHTVCDDCGETLACPVCRSALVLHGNERPKFICHFCGHEESAKVRCRNCEGWRLTPLGIGTERVAKEAAARFPAAKIHSLSDEPGRTSQNLRRIMDEFELNGGILVGTEGALNFMRRPVESAIVASVDSYLLLPEYSATERAFALLSELRGLTRGELLIQTRLPEHPVLTAAARASAGTLLEEELRLRERFRYPPQFIIVRITLEGKPEVAARERDKLKRSLERYGPQAISARSARAGNSRTHVIVRIPREKWPDHGLVKFLRELPPSFAVRINPRNLLSD